MKKKVICYAEGNGLIGMGHLYRQLTLSKTYSHLADFNFIFSEKSQKDFYDSNNLNSIDLEDLRSSKSMYDFSFYDSKICKEDFIKIFKEKSKSMVAIDVIEDWVRRFDFAVFPSFYIEPSDIPKAILESKTRILTGKDFVLLRKNNKEFYPETDWDILVTLGGSDPNNLTELIVNIIKNRSDYSRFLILIGPGFSKKKPYFDKKFPNLKFSDPVDNTFSLIKNSSIVLTCVGTTLQECEYLSAKTLIISNYLEDVIDIKRIKRSSYQPENFLSLGYFLDLKGVVFNNQVNDLLNKTIHREERKEEWGSGWDKIFV